jgi:hypothetical protein
MKAVHPDEALSLIPCLSQASVGGVMPVPHREERISRVSNHEAPISPAAILRDARDARSFYGSLAFFGSLGDR